MCRLCLSTPLAPLAGNRPRADEALCYLPFRRLGPGRLPFTPCFLKLGASRPKTFLPASSRFDGVVSARAFKLEGKRRQNTSIPLSCLFVWFQAKVGVAKVRCRSLFRTSKPSMGTTIYVFSSMIILIDCINWDMEIAGNDSELQSPALKTRIGVKADVQ